ncbi:hypothetical protein ILUMI_26841 [Ignelater luminosus]|uniref:Pre-mRNA-splicing factor 38 n=1 Tax=Ignelater luminosus TaxID=2038154 RepID=A0A8K0FVU5_IGNLU|nr:hypothetical protein ILUMI_26841 [Ignelater luminosus]
MANRTVKDAKSVHGTNPQYLIEKIIRSRIYDSKYWKEECFALTAELLVDRAMELRYIGGVYGGNIKPTPFLCLTLKMLQIQPEKDIVVEFIKNEEFKYVRALGAYYMRLTGSSLDCYKYLEPLYNDNRKLRRQNRSAEFELVHMDEFIDELLREERVCDVILPRVQKRYVLEENNEIEAKVSALEDDLDEDMELEEDNKHPVEEPPRREEKERHRDRKRERSRSRDRDRDKHRERDRGKHRDRDREREKDKEKDKDRRDRDRRKDEDRKRDRDRHH